MRLEDWLEQAVSGRGAIRFVLQPLIALVLAWRDGRRDAIAGDEPFFYRLLTRRPDRRGLAKSALSTLLLPLVLAFVIDSILQIAIFKSYRPRTSVAVAVLLVGLPYSVFRGLACRVVRGHRRAHRVG